MPRATMTNKRPPLQSTLPRLRPAAPDMIYWPYDESAAADATVTTGHYHWTVQAFSGRGENGELFDVATIRVEAQDEMGAIQRAMGIIQRANYRVQMVDEACSIDPALKRG